MASETTTGAGNRWFEQHSVFAAYLGAVAGIGALFLGIYRLWMQRGADLEATATVTANDFTDQVFGVRASLNNDGLGGVTIKGAELLLAGQSFAEAAGHVRDVASALEGPFCIDPT